MSYRYLDDIALADVAFEARGSSTAELFRSAWEATLHTMVDNPESIKPSIFKQVEMKHEKADILLHDFLQELIYYKDAEGLLLRVVELEVRENGEGYRLDASLAGESINGERHEMSVDVKAVTFHHLLVERRGDGWIAIVVLDV
jgi:SHS2 domain-containing protein